jgi:hypothetical protein
MRSLTHTNPSSIMHKWHHRWFGFWRESPENPNAPSINDWVCPGWITASEKRRIIEFLEDGIDLSITTARFPKCPICGSIASRSIAFLSDGYWIWSNHLVHQVEEHEVMLPVEFVQHIRSHNYSVIFPQVADEVEEEALVRSLDWTMK